MSISNRGGPATLASCSRSERFRSCTQATDATTVAAERVRPSYIARLSAGCCSDSGRTPL
jgi:hypothetical protein